MVRLHLTTFPTLQAGFGAKRRPGCVWVELHFSCKRIRGSAPLRTRLVEHSISRNEANSRNKAQHGATKTNIFAIESAERTHGISSVQLRFGRERIQSSASLRTRLVENSISRNEPNWRHVAQHGATKTNNFAPESAERTHGGSEGTVETGDQPPIRTRGLAGTTAAAPACSCCLRRS